jgi:hypothetical protein
MKTDVRHGADSGRTECPPLLLTRTAASRLSAYAVLADEDEFMVILLGKKTANCKDTVADVILLHDQRVGGASVNVTGHGINKSIWEIQEKYPDTEWEILGWGHGHGHLDVFHSRTDDQNTEEVFLEQLAPIRTVMRQRVSRMDLAPDEGGCYLLSAEHGHSIKLLNARTSGILRIEKRSPCYSGWIYSLVTNAKHAYYAERFSKNWCAGCDSVTTTHSRIDVKVLRESVPSTLDYDGLRKEFSEKVKRSFCIGFSRWSSEEPWHADDRREGRTRYPLVYSKRHASESGSMPDGSASTSREEEWKD